MGMVPSLSCDYYLGTSYYPTVGQHCSWGESSAIPWCNAVFGARTNFDGGFQTAYLGKTPYYDLHITEKRAATVLVNFEGELNVDMDWELFGWAAGEALGNKIPAFTGVPRPTVTQLVKMNGALNTGGQVHVPYPRRHAGGPHAGRRLPGQGTEIEADDHPRRPAPRI